MISHYFALIYRIMDINGMYTYPTLPYPTLSLVLLLVPCMMITLCLFSLLMYCSCVYVVLRMWWVLYSAVIGFLVVMVRRLLSFLVLYLIYCCMCTCVSPTLSLSLSLFLHAFRLCLLPFGCPFLILV